jgi:effector-binding domain-containing protein
MMTLPQIETRPAQHYAYVPFEVTMAQMTKPADEGFPQLYAWLDRHGIEPVGAPFYNYRRIDMDRTLDVEAGIPVAQPGPEEGAIKSGTLPGGRFMSLSWHGHYDGLMTVTGMLIGWVRLIEEQFDMYEAADGEHFACRLELYETDPSVVKKPEDWVTKLAFKLKG